MSTNGLSWRFAVHADTLILEEVLAKATPGQEFTYAQLGAIIGVQDIRAEQHRTKLHAARKRLARRGLHFLTIHGQGWRRMTDAEFLDEDARAMRHERRVNNRAQQRLLAADPEKLAPSERAELFARMSFRGVVEMMHRPAALKRIEERTKEVKASLPTAEMLKLFE